MRHYQDTVSASLAQSALKCSGSWEDQREGGEVREEQETRRGIEKGGVSPIGPFVMRLICTTALNWLQQLINVLESWHKKFI